MSGILDNVETFQVKHETYYKGNFRLVELRLPPRYMETSGNSSFK
jgi:hypothetical protein